MPQPLYSSISGHWHCSYQLDTIAVTNRSKKWLFDINTFLIYSKKGCHPSAPRESPVPSPESPYRELCSQK